MSVFVYADMKALRIADSASVSLRLKDEIRRSAVSRYDHRLHSVLLVAQGMTCPKVARLFGDTPRSVENWVRSYELYGLRGLLEDKRPGRARRLNPQQQLKSMLLCVKHRETQA